MFAAPDRHVVFLDACPDTDRVLDLLERLLDGTGFSSAGLGFVDRELASFLPTNWDLGETEEWQEVLVRLASQGRVIHTFSATDLAIELSLNAGTIHMQILDWETVPSRLDTSRQIAPVHIFEGAVEMMSDIERCLGTLQRLKAAARLRTGRTRELLQFLSVSSRLGDS